MKDQKIIAEIENQFSARDMIGVRRLMPKLLALSRRDPQARLRAAEFLLRIPDPAKAFRILSDHDLNAESRLLLANAANFLGASRYGLQVLDTVSETMKIKRRVETGQILVTTYNDLAGLKYFANVGSATNPKPALDEAGERAMLLRCYPLLELKRWAEVSAICDFFLDGKHSAGQEAFALIFSAWASAEQGNFAQAFALLKKFDELPGQGDMWPHALYQQVAGMCRAKARQYKKALAHLEMAWKKSFHPGLQPEATWLNVLYWKGFVKFHQEDIFPEEWARLCAFPSVTNVFRNRIEEITPIPNLLILDAKKCRKAPHPLHIDQSANCTYKNGAPKLGLTTSMLLLGFLVGAGPLGIPMFRIFDVLWPDEPLSLRTHLKRLEQAVSQLRRKGYGITWKDNHLWADRAAGISIEWKYLPNGNESSADSFLRTRNSFKRLEVQSYYKVSERTAKRICQKWARDGLVRAEGNGRKHRYIVVA